MSKNVIIGVLAILLTVVVSITCTVYFTAEEELPDLPAGELNMSVESFPNGYSK